MDNCLQVASGHFEKLFDIEYHQNHPVTSLTTILQHIPSNLPKYSDQIASEPFMDNCPKVASGHFEKMFFIECHQNHLVSS